MTTHTITINLKDYGELIGEDYSFGSATINITLNEYNHLLNLKNQKEENIKHKEKENQFLSKFEDAVKSYSMQRKQKEELLNDFSKLKNKEATLDTLETLINKIESLRFIAEKSKAWSLLEYLKTNHYHK